MLEPPLPPDETLRLGSLRRLDILDTPPEERFDRITRTLAALLDVPIVLVSLIDENRQWFKSCVGLDVSQTDRSISFCAHAILQPDTFVIPDAHDDPRFADNPLVTGTPYIRFYAGEPLLDGDGRALGTLCAIDTAPRRLAPEQLLHLRDLGRWAATELRTVEVHRGYRRFQGLLRGATGHGIIGADLAGSIDVFNQGAEALLGWKASDAVGRPVTEMLAGNGDRLAQLETELTRRDGSTVPVSLVTTPQLDEEGAVAGWVTVADDISERLEVQRLKDEFLSVVSHELRTPLTSIRGSLGLLANGLVGSVDDEGREMLDVAVTNTDRLMRLINDLLDLERMDDGQLPLELNTTNLRALVRASIAGVAGMARDRGVAVALSDGDEPLVLADHDRMVQAVTNLLSNAIKFSPDGGTVRVGVARQNSNAIVSVVDHGRGIPADRLAAVFERFEQVESGDSRSLGGSGLGLPITRSILEQHGGTVEVESTVGEGSTFRLRLPVALPLATNQ